MYWWDCGVKIGKAREVQTARNCVLVGLWVEKCKGERSADCKKLCTGGIVGGEL